MSHHNERFVAAQTQLIQDLKAEREKSNALVDQVDYLGAVLMCLMNKHKYQQLKIAMDEVRQALKSQTVIFRGDENQNLIVEIESKPQSYNDFIQEVKPS